MTKQEETDQEFRYDCLVRMIAAERDHYKIWCYIFIFWTVALWIFGISLMIWHHPAPAKDPACQDIESKYQKIIRSEGADAATDYYPPTEDTE